MMTVGSTHAATQSRRLADVRPELAAAYRRALLRWMGDRKLMLLGLPMVVEGYRANAVQAAYYAQGRQPVAQVNALRKAAGLASVSAYEAGRVVTHKLPGTSNHNKLPSQAIDVALLQADGKVKWDHAALLLFSRLICHADARVVWGGDWDGDGETDDEKFRDWPHFELTG